MRLHYVRGGVKTAAKLLVAVFSSFVAAFVWWAWFPEPPPLPDQFLVAFEPIVMWVAGRNVHGAEELLGFLDIWCYVATTSICICCFLDNSPKDCNLRSNQ